MDDQRDVPSPDEVDALDTLPLDVAQNLVRTWRNHWADVARIGRDFPDDIKHVLAVRPSDTREALRETVAQFAVLFNPEAVYGFCAYLDAVLRTLEALEASASPPHSGEGK